MEMSGIVEIKTLVTDGCVSGPEHAVGATVDSAGAVS